MLNQSWGVVGIAIVIVFSLPANAQTKLIGKKKSTPFEAYASPDINFQMKPLPKPEALDALSHDQISTELRSKPLPAEVVGVLQTKYAVDSIAASPDGKWIATCGWSGGDFTRRLELRNIADLTSVVFSDKKTGARELVFSPTGHVLATVGPRPLGTVGPMENIFLWDIGAANPRPRQLPGVYPSSRAAPALAFAPNGKYFAIAASIFPMQLVFSDGSAISELPTSLDQKHLRDRVKSQLELQLGHPKFEVELPLAEIAFTNTVATLGWTAIERSLAMQMLDDNSISFNRQRLSADALSAYDKYVSLRVEQRKLQADLGLVNDKRKALGESVAFAPDGRSIVIVCYGAAFEWWRQTPPSDPDGKTTLGFIGGDRLNTESDESVSSVRFSPDNSTLALLGTDGVIRLRNRGERTKPPLEIKANSSITSFTFSPDAKRLALILAKGSLAIWDLGFGHGQNGEGVQFSVVGYPCRSCARCAPSAGCHQGGGYCLCTPIVKIGVRVESRC